MNSRMQQENSLNSSKYENLLQPSQQVDNRQTEHIYECISESKLSGWNGRYSLNDKVWDKVDPRKKIYLYQQMQ